LPPKSINESKRSSGKLERSLLHTPSSGKLCPSAALSPGVPKLIVSEDMVLFPFGSSLRLLPSRALLEFDGEDPLLSVSSTILTNGDTNVIHSASLVGSCTFMLAYGIVLVSLSREE
jgi:hypothetical protein